MLLSDTHPFV
ncbi:hypothetical protein D041_0627A, partial [Vibrio parahaemolyticus EKP-008]